MNCELHMRWIVYNLEAQGITELTEFSITPKNPRVLKTSLVLSFRNLIHLISDLKSSTSFQTLLAIFGPHGGHFGPAPKLIKISTRPSYVDVLLTVLVTFEAGEGGSPRGKNKNSGYLEN